MPGSAISRHVTIAPERSARSPDDDMVWRGQLWRLAIGSWIKTRRFRCRADVNRCFMILLRRRVGRCAFSARFLRPVVEALMLAMRDIQAPSHPGRAIRTGLVGAPVPTHLCYARRLCREQEGDAGTCTKALGATFWSDRIIPRAHEKTDGLVAKPDQFGDHHVDRNRQLLGIPIIG